MFSYEDRVRAVKLYIKLGKRSAATIRQLGYPTKQSLSSWYRELQGNADLHKGYQRSRAKYSLEQQGAAIQHYLDHGRCMSFTIRELGYPCRETFLKWVETHCQQASQTDPEILRSGFPN